MNYWLLKTEPETYSFDDLLRERTTVWDGVRNNWARAQLERMRPGDQSLIYHTGRERSAVGLAQISSAAYVDPTDSTGRWLAVDVSANTRLPRPVALKILREHPAFAGSALTTAPRLSVVPIPAELWEQILLLAGHSL